MDDPQFASAEEFRAAIDWVFRTMSEDADLGPKFREADVAQRFEYADLELVLNVRPGRDGEDAFLHWQWDDDIDWEPQLRVEMDSATANRYFQGKENVAMAIARRRIKPGGDVKAVVTLIPVYRPIHERYRGYIADQMPHLLA